MSEAITISLPPIVITKDITTLPIGEYIYLDDDEIEKIIENINRSARGNE